MADEDLLETQKSAIEALETLIAEIRHGRVLEFIGMVIQTDDDYYFVGGNTDDRHRCAGMLMELAMERLRQNGPSDEDE